MCKTCSIRTSIPSILVFGTGSVRCSSGPFCLPTLGGVNNFSLTGSIPCPGFTVARGGWRFLASRTLQSGVLSFMMALNDARRVPLQLLYSEVVPLTLRLIPLLLTVPSKLPVLRSSQPSKLPVLRSSHSSVSAPRPHLLGGVAVAPQRRHQRLCQRPCQTWDAIFWTHELFTQCLF